LEKKHSVYYPLITARKKNERKKKKKTKRLPNEKRGKQSTPLGWGKDGQDLGGWEHRRKQGAQKFHMVWRVLQGQSSRRPRKRRKKGQKWKETLGEARFGNGYMVLLPRK